MSRHFYMVYFAIFVGCALFLACIAVGAWNDDVHGPAIFAAATVLAPVYLATVIAFDPDGQPLAEWEEHAIAAGGIFRFTHPGGWVKTWPKEAWETPRPGTRWYGVLHDGRVSTQHGGFTAEPRLRGGDYAAVVECDIIPRLDTLKKVER